MYSFGFGVPSKPVSASAPAFGVNGFQISSTNYQWTHTLAANPTVRPDGSALISGDRIYDSTTGEQWWWNGTLWLSHEFQAQSWINNFANTITVSSIFDTPIGRDVFIKEVLYSFNPLGSVSTTPTLTLTTAIRTVGGPGTLLFNNPLTTGITISNGVRMTLKQSVGVNAAVRSLGANSSGIAVSSTSSLGFTIGSCNLGLRWALVR